MSLTWVILGTIGLFLYLVFITIPTFALMSASIGGARQNHYEKHRSGKIMSGLLASLIPFTFLLLPLVSTAIVWIQFYGANSIHNYWWFSLPIPGGIICFICLSFFD